MHAYVTTGRSNGSSRRRQGYYYLIGQNNRKRYSAPHTSAPAPSE